VFEHQIIFSSMFLDYNFAFSINKIRIFFRKGILNHYKVFGQGWNILKYIILNINNLNCRHNRTLYSEFFFSPLSLTLILLVLEKNGRIFVVIRIRNKMWSKYIICMYENIIMKPIKIILKGGIIKSNRGDDMIKVHYMHVWNYHNESLCTINIC
jgi:hypothetical protein